MSDQILVLGAGGFVGQHLVRALAQRGESVIAVSRKPVDFPTAGVDTLVGPLTEPEHFVPLLARCRAVVHLASGSTPGSSAGHPLAELDTNLRPTLALLQSMQEQPLTKLLYLSSGGSLYGEHSAPSTEVAALEPRSYHGAAKVAAEHFISAWASQYGGAATILRPSNIYGPGQNERAGFGIVPAVFGKITRDETLTIWGDGSAVRDYLYIDDLVELCLAVLAGPMAAGTLALNAASGAGVSLNDLLHSIEGIAGKRLSRTYHTQRPVDARRIVMDPGLAQKLYGWSATTSLHDGLRQAWNWFNTILH